MGVYLHWMLEITGHNFFFPGPSVKAISLDCANIVNGSYRYTQDLVQLAAFVSSQPSPLWPRYHSPIRMENLSPFLNSHPDATYAAYIREGLTKGFRIGFNYSNTSLRSRGSNHPSTLANERVVDDRIATEVAAGRLHGPLPLHLKPLAHTSPMGLVPKLHQLNKFRLIVDLSHPIGASVNDGISPDLCSLRYASVDEAVNVIRRLGRDAQLTKLDIKDAYRIIPVNPDDYHLLGISWRGATYIDRALPFGLRSAPKIFSAVADLVAWVLHQQGIKHQLHYLDDFLFLDAATPQGSTGTLEQVLRIFQGLGIPIATQKTEGPNTALVFLGILIDTHRFELRLPLEKLTRLQTALQHWKKKRSCTRRELESLLGHLSHAATVVRQGRTFLRQLFPLLSLNRAPHHWIRLNAGSKADLLWWSTFLQGWNGTSFFPISTPSTDVTSDASGSFGCGAFSLSHGWFQIQWPDNWHSLNIAAKELVPIVIAAALWGHHWKHSCVCFNSDNMAVVGIIRSRTAKDPLLMHLVRCLVFYAASCGFEFIAEHVPGVDNTAADAISRNNIPLFHSLVPQLSHVTVPKVVLDLLVTRMPNWGSQEWTVLLARSLIRESQDQPELCTNQAGASTSTSAHNTPCPHFLLRNTPSASLPPSSHSQ